MFVPGSKSQWISLSSLYSRCRLDDIRNRFLGAVKSPSTAARADSAARPYRATLREAVMAYSWILDSVLVWKIVVLSQPSCGCISVQALDWPSKNPV